ncbi:MAG: hypothetical protein WCU88_06200 [Elusimicrobiota bacterium]|jgi:hypothetical protein
MRLPTLTALSAALFWSSAYGQQNIGVDAAHSAVVPIGNTGAAAASVGSNISGAQDLSAPNSLVGGIAISADQLLLPSGQKRHARTASAEKAAQFSGVAGPQAGGGKHASHSMKRFTAEVGAGNIAVQPGVRVPQTSVLPNKGSALTSSAQEGAGGMGSRLHPGGEGGGSDLHGLDTAIGRVKDKEKRSGAKGLLDGLLQSFFDRSHGSSNPEIRPDRRQEDEDDSSIAMPDPKLLGPEKALEKVQSLAADASAADAPKLYRHALNIADDLPSGSMQERGRILAAARMRAPKDVSVLADQVLFAVVSGVRGGEVRRLTKALSSWSSLLAVGRKPYIEGLENFLSAAQGLRSIGEFNPGAGRARSSAPKSLVEPLDGGLQVRLRLRDSVPAGALAISIPASFAEAWSLVGVRDIEAPEALAVSGGRSLYEAFALAPRAGLLTLYRDERSRGKSALAGFWSALRSWTTSRVQGWMDRLRAGVLLLLQRMGFLSGLAEPSFAVDSSPEVLQKLRSLPVKRVSSHPQRLPAGMLGYSLYPTLH